MGNVHASRIVERDDIEILLDDFNHYQAMLKWKDIDETPSDVVEVKKEKNAPKLQARLIYSRSTKKSQLGISNALVTVLKVTCISVMLVAFRGKKKGNCNLHHFGD